MPGTQEGGRGGTSQCVIVFVGKIQGGGLRRRSVPIIELTSPLPELTNESLVKVNSVSWVLCVVWMGGWMCLCLYLSVCVCARVCVCVCVCVCRVSWGYWNTPPAPVLLYQGPNAPHRIQSQTARPLFGRGAPRPPAKGRGAKEDILTPPLGLGVNPLTYLHPLPPS